MTKHKLQPENWVDQYADYLFNYAVSRVSDAEIAKDLVQETFFAGLNSAKNFKGDAAERTWLVSILKRKVIDHYRKINSKKGKAEVRINYSSDSDAGVTGWNNKLRTLSVKMATIFWKMKNWVQLFKIVSPNCRKNRPWPLN